MRYAICDMHLYIYQSYEQQCQKEEKEILCYTFRHSKRILQINNRFMESFRETERNKTHTSYNSTSRDNTWALRPKFKMIYITKI